MKQFANALFRILGIYLLGLALGLVVVAGFSATPKTPPPAAATVPIAKEDCPQLAATSRAFCEATFSHLTNGFRGVDENGAKNIQAICVDAGNVVSQACVEGKLAFSAGGVQSYCGGVSDLFADSLVAACSGLAEKGKDANSKEDTEGMMKECRQVAGVERQVAFEVCVERMKGPPQDLTPGPASSMSL